MANSYARTDKFGNVYTVCGLKGDSFPSGYCELNGVLYKFTVTTSQKEGVTSWLRITKVKKNRERI